MIFFLTVISMENVENEKITPESVLLLIREMALSFDKGIQEARAGIQEVRAEIAKSHAERVETEAQIAKSRVEFEAQIAKSRSESEARFEREMAESRAEFDRRSADFDRRMKNLDDMIVGVSNSNGAFAEEFFFNALDMGDRQFFGEHFDDCYSLVKRYNKSNQKRSEHDILLVNGKSLAIVEVKYKARKEDVQKIINKIPDFRLP